MTLRVNHFTPNPLEVLWWSEQHDAKLQEWTPEARVWIAVLNRAIEDAIHVPGKRNRKLTDRHPRSSRYSYERMYGEEIRKEAQAWIDSDSMKQQSFRWICFYLGLDAHKIRMKIKSLPCK